MPEVCLLTNGTYAHQPEWYRNFLYEQEQERGLDFLEDLASPGTLQWDLSQDAVAMFSTSSSVGATSSATSAIQILKDLRDSEAKRRKSFPTPLYRSADAYLVRRAGGQTIIAGYP